MSLKQKLKSLRKSFNSIRYLSHQTFERRERWDNFCPLVYSKIEALTQNIDINKEIEKLFKKYKIK